MTTHSTTEPYSATFLGIARRKRFAYVMALFSIALATIPPTVSAFVYDDKFWWLHVTLNGLVFTFVVAIAIALRDLHRLRQLEGYMVILGWSYLYSWTAANLIWHRFPVDALGGDAPIALLPAVLGVYWLPRRRVIWVTFTLMAIYMLGRWAAILQFEWRAHNASILTTDLVTVAVLIMATLVAAYSDALWRTGQESLRMGSLALTDPLTGLPNRRSIEQSLGIQDAKVLMLIDLDDFKKVNDLRGHNVGDETLQRVAATLKKVFAHYEPSPALVGRWGGEEFLVVLPGCNVARARELAEQARRCVAELPCDPHITLSLGMTLATADEPWHQAVQRCDALMYHAKRLGKNRCCCDTGLGQNQVMLPASRRSRYHAAV